MADSKSARRDSGDLSALLLPELRKIAANLGIENAAELKKPDLVKAITDLQAANREAAKAEREARRAERNQRRNRNKNNQQDDADHDEDSENSDDSEDSREDESGSASSSESDERQGGRDNRNDGSFIQGLPLVSIRNGLRTRYTLGSTSRYHVHRTARRLHRTPWN